MRPPPHRILAILGITATALVVAGAGAYAYTWWKKNARVKGGVVSEEESESDESGSEQPFEDAVSTLSDGSGSGLVGSTEQGEAEEDEDVYVSADDEKEPETSTPAQDQAPAPADAPASAAVEPEPKVEAEPNAEAETKKSEPNKFWDTALMLADRDAVPCRTVRAVETLCESRTDFLARLHCLRNSTTPGADEFGNVNEEEDAYLSDSNSTSSTGDVSGEEITALIGMITERVGSAFLKLVGNDPSEFRLALRRLLAVPQSVMKKELAPRSVVSLSFFDLLDFFVLDGFDDLENPPPVVTSAAGNTWIPARVRGSTVENAVWTIIKAKRAAEDPSHEFLTSFYDVTAAITPALSRILLCRESEHKYRLAVWLKQTMLKLAVDAIHCAGPEVRSAAEVRANLLEVCRECDKQMRKRLGYRR